MRTLGIEQMENVEGGGWLDCGAMVLFGVATVVGAAAATSAGPLGLAATSAILAGAGATLSAAQACGDTKVSS